MTTQKTQKKTNYGIPLLLVILFIGPLLMASILFHDKNFNPGKSNYGQLLPPSYFLKNLDLYSMDGKVLDQNTLLGKWQMFYVAPTSCDTNCQKNLFKMRQIRLAMGKDQDRIERIIVTVKGRADPALEQLLQGPYQGTQQFSVNRDDLAIFLKNFSDKQTVLEQGYLFIIDPHGNMIMAYSLTEPPKGIMSDFHRLLNVSQIG